MMSWYMSLSSQRNNLWSRIANQSRVQKLSRYCTRHTFRKKSLYTQEDWKNMSSLRSVHSGVRISVLLVCVVFILGFGRSIR